MGGHRELLRGTKGDQSCIGRNNKKINEKIQKEFPNNKKEIPKTWKECLRGRALRVTKGGRRRGIEVVLEAIKRRRKSKNKIKMNCKKISGRKPQNSERMLAWEGAESY